MTQFSQTVLDFWHSRFPPENTQYDDGGFSLTVNPALNDKRRVMVITSPDGRATAVVTPEILGKLRLPEPPVAEAAFRYALRNAGVKLHDPDLCFHFSASALSDLVREPDPTHVRQLTSADKDRFGAFQSDASASDRDEAFVELDHWAVFGAFDDGRLVAATSMYPWEESRLADLGVLTLPSFRGRGHGRDVVRAVGRYAHRQGYETQYRCQQTNQASARLAKASGLSLFGRWEVIA